MRASVSAKRINEVISTKPSILDPENPVSPEKLGTIEFDHVSFRYADGEDDVLHDISFTVHKGDRIAQVVFARYERAAFTPVEEIAGSERGAGGFGHTGIK